MDFAAFSEALSGMDPTMVALGAGLAGALVVLMGVGALAWFVVSSLGYYKMFRKAGQRGWMAFIPLLRDYVRYKMSWNVKAFVIYLVSVIAVELLGESETILLGLIGAAGAVSALVMEAKACVRIAKSFGKSKGWGALLFFFPYVVTLILGFGKAEYIGNTTVASEVE